DSSTCQHGKKEYYRKERQLFRSEASPELSKSSSCSFQGGVGGCRSGRRVAWLYRGSTGWPFWLHQTAVQSRLRTRKNAYGYPVGVSVLCRKRQDILQVRLRGLEPPRGCPH